MALLFIGLVLMCGAVVGGYIGLLYSVAKHKESLLVVVPAVFFFLLGYTLVIAGVTTMILE